MAAYSAAGDRGDQVTEFKQMVKNLHQAGIEVILDVVYNHTAEAGATGPTLSFRGLDDRGFYRRQPVEPKGKEPGAFTDTYWDITGCGNTVDTGNPTAKVMSNNVAELFKLIVLLHQLHIRF